MNEYRTYNCSQIREKNVGEEIKLAGWIDTIRDLGGVLFIDLRDQYGVTQVVVSGDEAKVDFAARIPVESTITVSGKVRLRDEETVNEAIETGKVELFADEIKILGKRTKQLPFEISNNRNVREDLRLEYRFLDLRAKKSLENNNAVATKTEKLEKKSNDITKMTVAELRELAKAKGIEGYTAMKKAELLEVLK